MTAIDRNEALSMIRASSVTYAAQEAGRRGWPTALIATNESVDCQEQLGVPVFGKEFRCAVVTTYCVR